MTKELISQEPYTTTSGTSVLLTQLADEHARASWPAQFWTWRYENGWGPGIGSLSDRHLTREAAIERLEQKERISVLADAYGDSFPLTREQYVAACERAGLPARPDTDIAHSYGVRFGEFEMPEYQPDQIIAMKLARRRQAALDDEEQARRAAQPVVRPETVSCPSCGRETSRALLMNGSLGTCCPECWETNNDGDGYGV